MSISLNNASRLVLLETIVQIGIKKANLISIDVQDNDKASWVLPNISYKVKGNLTLDKKEPKPINESLHYMACMIGSYAKSP